MTGADGYIWELYPKDADGQGTTVLAVADRAGEVRQALRWDGNWWSIRNVSHGRYLAGYGDDPTPRARASAVHHRPRDRHADPVDRPAPQLIRDVHLPDGHRPRALSGRSGSGPAKASPSKNPSGTPGTASTGWTIATRFWRSMVGEPGGSLGIDNALAERHSVGIGAEIMGRGKFGPPEAGPWAGLGTTDEWRGWWGQGTTVPHPRLRPHPPPPALTRARWRQPLPFRPGHPGGSAAARARSCRRARCAHVGGPSTVRDFLAANLIDVLHVVQVPILLGRGVRLWDGLEGIEQRFEVEAVPSPSGVTHLTFTRR